MSTLTVPEMQMRRLRLGSEEWIESSCRRTEKSDCSWSHETNRGKVGRRHGNYVVDAEDDQESFQKQPFHRTSGDYRDCRYRK